MMKQAALAFVLSYDIFKRPKDATEKTVLHFGKVSESRQRWIGGAL